jgi:Zn-finger protein
VGVEGKNDCNWYSCHLSSGACTIGQKWT